MCSGKYQCVLVFQCVPVFLCTRFVSILWHPFIVYIDTFSPFVSVCNIHSFFIFFYKYIQSFCYHFVTSIHLLYRCIPSFCFHFVTLFILYTAAFSLHFEESTYRLYRCIQSFCFHFVIHSVFMQMHPVVLFQCTKHSFRCMSKLQKCIKIAWIFQNIMIVHLCKWCVK